MCLIANSLPLMPKKLNYFKSRELKPAIISGFRARGLNPPIQDNSNSSLARPVSLNTGKNKQSCYL